MLADIACLAFVAKPDRATSLTMAELPINRFNGQIGPVNTVGRTEVARAVPQMVRENDTLVLAWTDEMNELTKIASVKLPIVGFYD